MENKEEKKILKEGAKILRTLVKIPEVADAFEENGTVYYSERENKVFDSILFFASQDEEIAEMVSAFESKHKSVKVIHVIKDYHEDGAWHTLLFIRKDPGEWAQDEADYKAGEVVACCVTPLTDECGEVGYVGIRKGVAGGIVRAW